jgi:hypothetical protein
MNFTTKIDGNNLQPRILIAKPVQISHKDLLELMKSSTHLKSNLVNFSGILMGD